MGDWNIFLRRIKLLEFTAVLIVFLVFAGIMLILNARAGYISAMLVYLMSIFLDYIFTSGILLLQEHGHNDRKQTALLKSGITLFIILFSGYKFSSLFNYKMYAFPLYAALWYLYIRYKRYIFRAL